MMTIAVDNDDLARQIVDDGNVLEAIFGIAFERYGENPKRLARWAEDVVGGQSTANRVVAKALAKAAGVITD